jgi:NAD(P)-dependent dehydrogenase (short-subunit alcohol dehydrogenase family)
MDAFGVLRSNVWKPQVEAVTADMSSLAQVRRLAEEVSARYDRLDVLLTTRA